MATFGQRPAIDENRDLGLAPNTWLSCGLSFGRPGGDAREHYGEAQYSEISAGVIDADARSVSSILEAGRRRDRRLLR